MNNLTKTGILLGLFGLAFLALVSSYISHPLEITLSVILSCAMTIAFIYANRKNGAAFANFFFVSYFIFFPGAVLLLAILPDPTLAIEEEYWLAVPEVLRLQIFSMIAFWLGYHLTSRNASTVSFEHYTSFELPGFTFNFILVCSAGVNAIVGMVSGTYFHTATGADFNANFVESFGFFQYLTFLGNVGVAFQLLRVIRYKTQQEIWGLVILLFMLIVILFPSGTRRPIIFLFALVLYFVIWSKHNTFVRLKLALISFVVVFFLLPLMETYRLASGTTPDLFDKVTLFVNVFTTLDFGENENYSGFLLALIVAARRIADFCSVAHIISYFDNTGFRSITEISEGLLYALPNGLRPRIEVSMIYDALLMRDIGFRTSSPGSSPMMLLGDAYSFGGYYSVFAVFSIAGLGFGVVDRFTSKPTQLSFFVFVFLLDQAFSLTAYSILKVYIFFSRQILVAVIIYYIVKIIERRQVRRPTGAGIMAR
jgi:hypothetical protein